MNFSIIPTNLSSKATKIVAIIQNALSDHWNTVFFLIIETRCCFRSLVYVNLALEQCLAVSKKTVNIANCEYALLLYTRRFLVDM